MKFKELRNKTKACEDNEVSNRSAAMKPQMYNDPITGKKKVRMVPTKSNIVKTNDRVDEKMDPTKHVAKKGDMYCVYDKDGKEVAKFDNEDEANAYAIKNHDALMEVGFQGAAATATRVAALGAIGGAAYAAKKARDRFNPVKVADARRKRDEKNAEREKAKQDLNQRKQYRQKLRGMQQKQRAKQAQS